MRLAVFMGARPLHPWGAAAFGGRGAEGPPACLSGRFHSSQRSLRVAAKAASFNSLAHWASASLLPPLAALGSAPPPLRFPPTPKRQRKSPAIRPTQPRSVHRPKKGGGDRKPWRGRLQRNRQKGAGRFPVKAVRHGAYASCVGGRCPRFCGSSPGDRQSAGRTCRKGTGGPPAFQRGKGRY